MRSARVSDAFERRSPAAQPGYKRVKFLIEVNFLPAPTGGTWEDRGSEWFAGV